MIGLWPRRRQEEVSTQATGRSDYAQDYAIIVIVNNFTLHSLFKTLYPRYCIGISLPIYQIHRVPFPYLRRSEKWRVRPACVCTC